MTRFYRTGFIAALCVAAVWAQKPSIAQGEIEKKLERAREDMERAKEKMADIHLDLDMDWKVEPLLLAQQIGERLERIKPTISFSHGRDLYNRGMDALDQRDYERALREFDQYYRTAVDNKEMRGDGALYWKAYTLHKLGRRDESLATLAMLEKTFPTSRWLNDARALQLEVKQATGQGASPEAQTDEDLKLLAINGLMNTDAERVV